MSQRRIIRIACRNCRCLDYCQRYEQGLLPPEQAATLSPIRNCVVLAQRKHLLAAGLGAGSCVLEIGCGERDSVAELQIDPTVRWIATDVAVGKRHVGASVARLPYADQSFHLLFCHQVLEHIHETCVTYERAMREMHRVLKMGGFLSISVPLFVHGDFIFLEGRVRQFLAILRRRAFESVLVELYRWPHDPLPSYRPAFDRYASDGACFPGRATGRAEAGVPKRYQPRAAHRALLRVAELLLPALGVPPRIRWRVTHFLGGPRQSAQILAVLLRRAS